MMASCALRQGVLVAGEEQVLGQLLGDGRAAGDDLALLLVLFQRLLDALPVEALVLGELGVLGGNHRALEVDRYALRRAPTALQLRFRVLLAGLVEAQLMKLVVRRIDELPPQHPAEIPALPEQQQPENCRQPVFQPAGRWLHCVAFEQRKGELNAPTPRPPPKRG
jgi:hypothetical protein